MSYMHEKQCCHRDLKPDNIIYQPETGIVKIIDFGFAICSSEKLKVFCGTPSYMAPEIVQQKEYNGQAADMWACGVIMYYILVGILPFKSGDERGLFRKIEKAEYPIPVDAEGKRLSVEARDLIRQLLQPNPNLRI